MARVSLHAHCTGGGGGAGVNSHHNPFKLYLVSKSVGSAVSPWAPQTIDLSAHFFGIASHSETHL